MISANSPKPYFMTNESVTAPADSAAIRFASSKISVCGARVISSSHKFFCS